MLRRKNDLALDFGDDWSRIPVGVNQGDLAGVVYGDDVNAFEVDGFSVLALADSGPFYGGGIADQEDVVLSKADGLKEAEDAGDEAAESFMPIESRGSDRIVAGSGGGEGIDPAVDVHGAKGSEVFRDGLCRGQGHGEDFTLSF